MSSSNDTSVGKQLNDIQSEIKTLVKSVAELAVTYQHLNDNRITVATKVERIEVDFLAAKGAIVLLRNSLAVISTLIIGFCTYVFNTNDKQNEQIIHLQTELIEHKNQMEKNKESIERIERLVHVSQIKN